MGTAASLCGIGRRLPWVWLVITVLLAVLGVYLQVSRQRLQREARFLRETIAYLKEYEAIRLANLENQTKARSIEIQTQLEQCSTSLAALKAKCPAAGPS
eukprot:tig00020537_g10237.t2